MASKTRLGFLGCGHSGGPHAAGPTDWTEKLSLEVLRVGELPNSDFPDVQPVHRVADAVYRSVRSESVPMHVVA